MKTEVSNRFCLHPSVFYRCYGEHVIVYQTETQKVYTFNESAGDIIACLEEYASVSDILDELKEIYDMDDPKEQDAMEEYVASFLAELKTREIIKQEHRQIEVVENLEKEIGSYFPEGEQLFSATIELTYRCNEKCRHCYVVSEDKEEMTYEKIRSLLDELADMKAFNLVFTGGEVFLRDDAFALLEYAYQKHFLIDIFTNGTLLDGNDFIRLKSIWPRCVHFSLYSHIPEKHDAVTQVRGSFERTLNAIKSCILMGIPVNIKTPVFDETKDDVEGIVALANSLGCSAELSRNITPKKDGDLTPLDMKIDAADDERVVADVIDKLVDRIDNRQDPDPIRQKICGAGARSISINPYGEVFPCGMLSICLGNVNQETIRNIWENSERLQWWRENNRMSKLKGCGECEMINDCVFCPGEAMMRTGNPLVRYDTACLATEKAIRRRAEKGGDSLETEKEEI